MSFDEQQLAYAFPCTGLSQSEIERQLQDDTLWSQFIQLAAELPRYQHPQRHGLLAQLVEVSQSALYQEPYLCRQPDSLQHHRSRSPRRSPMQRDPVRRAVSRHRHRFRSRYRAGRHGRCWDCSPLSSDDDSDRWSRHLTSRRSHSSHHHRGSRSSAFTRHRYGAPCFWRRQSSGHRSPSTRWSRSRRLRSRCSRSQHHYSRTPSRHRTSCRCS